MLSPFRVLLEDVLQRNGMFGSLEEIAELLVNDLVVLMLRDQACTDLSKSMK